MDLLHRVAAPNHKDATLMMYRNMDASQLLCEGVCQISLTLLNRVRLQQLQVAVLLPCQAAVTHSFLVACPTR